MKIERAQLVIEDSYQSQLVPHYPTFCFQGKRSYEKLRRKLQDGDGCLLRYFDESLRKDWNAETGELALRLMPSSLYELVEELLVDAIKGELDRVAKANHSLQAIRKDIRDSSHASLHNSSIEYPVSVYKPPDGQFFYDDIRGAPFVIEISYSEKEHELLTRIKEYFIYLHSVSTVLAVDIEYAPPEIPQAPDYTHRATVCLWTAKRTGETIDIQRHKKANFRGNGQAVPGQLIIPFK
ncbi:hypothetical protein F4782DRAFT_529362 [Xylaria castorea]|nr:hypothetical protein F4782DRAFT_529362 [Xylaria castorea]